MSPTSVNRPPRHRSTDVGEVGFGGVSGGVPFFFQFGISKVIESLVNREIIVDTIFGVTIILSYLCMPKAKPLRTMNKKIMITALLFMVGIAANAQFIFRISGNGLEKPSYMLGSVHVLSGDLLDSIPAFLEAENQCQQLYVEEDFSDPQNKKDRRATGQQLVTLPDGKTISDILGKEKMNILQERTKELLHINLADSAAQKYLHYQPFYFTFLFYSIINMEALQKYPAMRNGNMMDGACMQRAKARGWKVGNLDRQPKPEEVDEAKEHESQSIDAQVDTLMELLNNFDEHNQKVLKEFEGLQTMCDYWSAGDYEGFERFIQPVAEACPALYADRNKKWMPIITEAIKEAPTLFVFGTGHLTGSEGIVNQLRKAGFVVEQVK